MSYNGEIGILGNKATFQRWLTAIYGDYEGVLTRFVSDLNWDFETFKQIVGSYKTVLLHHCSIGQGKFAVKQYETITRIIIQVAQNFWLRHPMKDFLENILNDEYLEKSEPPYRVKAMLAGFYLTYIMFKTQGKERATKILIDIQDLMAFHYFKLCVVKCEQMSSNIKLSLSYMMHDLILDSAFEIVGDSNPNGLDSSIRDYTYVMGSSIATQAMAATDFNMKLAWASSQEQSLLAELASFDVKKEKMLKMSFGGILSSIIAGNISNNSDAPSTSGASRCTSVSLIRPADSQEVIPRPLFWGSLLPSCQLRMLKDIPNLSSQNLLADGQTQFSMMTRALRIHNKAQKKSNRKQKNSSGNPSSGYNFETYLRQLDN